MIRDGESITIFLSSHFIEAESVINVYESSEIEDRWGERDRSIPALLDKDLPYFYMFEPIWWYYIILSDCNYKIASSILTYK